MQRPGEPKNGPRRWRLSRRAESRLGASTRPPGVAVSSPDQNAGVVACAPRLGRGAFWKAVPVCLLAFALFASAAPAADFVTSPAASVLVCGGSMMRGDAFVDEVVPVLRAHYAGVRRVVLVLHALHPADRDGMEVRLQRAFAAVEGIAAESIHRRSREGQLELLAKAEGIFVAGGETFVLLAELQRSGQLELIRARVLAGVPYGGTSAGANVAGPHVGTTNDFPTTEVASRSALAVFPHVINPHHPPAGAGGEHAARAGKIRAYLRFNPGESVLGLANASIAVLRGGRVTMACGEGWLHQATGTRELRPGDELPAGAAALPR